MTAQFLMRPPLSGLGKIAQREWQHFYELLAGVLGATVEVLPGSDHLEQIQLSAQAIAFNGQVIGQSSVDLTLQQWCERREWQWIKADIALDGRDWRWDEMRQLFWVGLRPGEQRLLRQTYQSFAGTAQPELVPLTLAHPLIRHLDECFCPLPNGQVLYYPEALSLDALALVEEYIPADCRIEASYQDTLNGACQAVAIGRTLVMHSASSELRNRLNQHGFRVFSSDLTEFEGAANALCLPLCGLTQPAFVGLSEHCSPSQCCS
ncbi:hypothetical protein [Leptolyngbya sp. FACHB-261]|uniref:hypothetical protein n=1 Tax=Leptolyngbya sp. FACHB-261 TaxID=2692806 RepID=UPI001688D615|nr:hypothetical protein [Leptolyngbya sp. FACHB-261]MBD2100743.1 hypothetical protein [Leptolyngbya sp. FACHB-261]